MNNLMTGSIFKETPQKRVAKKEDFVNINSVEITGKIVKAFPSGKNGYAFIISITPPAKKRPKQNSGGLYLRDLIPVYFYDKAAKIYSEKFHVGEFVTIRAIAQTIRRREGDHTAIWGLDIHPAKEPYRDRNRVYIRGKIDRIKVISNNYIIVNVETKCDVSYPNPNPESEISMLTETFKSVTPVGLRIKDNASEIAKSYTKGTWVDISGFVDARKTKNSTRKKMHIIATHVEIIGTIQKDSLS